jgi:hypothetical protein
VTRREKIGAWGPSPLGLSYSLYAVDPQQLSRAAARQTTCRLGETGIHRQHREIFESWSKRRGHR